MRELDFLRKALKKCHNYSDVRHLKLPKGSFRRSFDLPDDDSEFSGGYYHSAYHPEVDDVTKNDDGSVTIMIRHLYWDEDEEGYEYVSSYYTSYSLHPRKGFVYEWNS